MLDSQLQSNERGKVSEFSGKDNAKDLDFVASPQVKTLDLNVITGYYVFRSHLETIKLLANCLSPFCCHWPRRPRRPLPLPSPGGL